MPLYFNLLTKETINERSANRNKKYLFFYIEYSDIVIGYARASRACAPSKRGRNKQAQGYYSFHLMLQPILGF